jgi:N-acetylglucosaminyldiphosphoundecaprenol N-acetyl-beta-D-mannosaminyltransferase
VTARSERPPRRIVEVLGVGVDASSLDETADRILWHVDGRTGGYVCVRDVHGIILCQDDLELREIHRRAALVTTDGMPLVRAVKRAGHIDATRVYGPDLMLEVCGRRVGTLRHFLYGSSPEVLADLRENLEARFPGLKIVGTHSPPYRSLTEEESETEREVLWLAGPDVVWVGLSTPKQERWMAANVDHLGGAVLIGVGAAFDFHAGRKRQAPRWMQRSGLEWLFRMLREPRRLGRRYLVVVPRFLWLMARERMRRD